MSSFVDSSSGSICFTMYAIKISAVKQIVCVHQMHCKDTAPLQYHMDSATVILYVCAASICVDFIMEFHACSAAIGGRKWTQTSSSK